MENQTDSATEPIQVENPANEAPSEPVKTMNDQDNENTEYASFVDGIILGIPAFLLAMPSMNIGRGSDFVSPGTTALTSALPTLINWVYFVVFTGMNGQTLGKKLLKIKVVKEGTAEHPSYGTAFLREVIGKIVSGIVFGLGYLWVIWDDKKQAWHDKIAGTVVVRSST